jgi:hypothetical protein
MFGYVRLLKESAVFRTVVVKLREEEHLRAVTHTRGVPSKEISHASRVRRH